MAVSEGIQYVLENSTKTTVALYSVAAFTLYWVLVILYRIFLHPIAHIPGPWMAASQLYQYYYDGVLGGQFYRELERLHGVYGPVVRIGPNEVHLSDPENYDKIYSITTKFYKDPVLYGVFGNPQSHFSISSNELHRKQRAVLNPYFARRVVLEQEDIIQAKATKLCNRVESDMNQGIDTWLAQAFRAFSLDVISQYSFGTDYSYNFLEAPDLGRWWNDMIQGLNKMVPFALLMPSLVKVMQSMPDWLSVKINPVISGMVACRMTCSKMVDTVVKDMDAGIQPERKTIFHGLISAGEEGELKGIHVTQQYLSDEAFTILGAAAETVGNTLTIGAYHMIQNPEYYAKARKELIDNFPDEDNMPYSELEKLPYLTAVIKEALRTGYGVVHTLPRATPPGGYNFNDHFLPEKTIVGMSVWFLNRHPDAFPDPDKFDPGRWMVDQAEVYRLDHYMAPFSRGARGCIGQNLAYAELYIAFGRFFRHFDGLATDVTPKDMSFASYFTVFHPAGSKKFTVHRKQKA